MSAARAWQWGTAARTQSRVGTRRSRGDAGYLPSPTNTDFCTPASMTWFSSRRRARDTVQHQLRRGMATSYPDDSLFLPMPKLSPSMTSGKIRSWLKVEGEDVNEYDVVLELTTDSLYAPGEAPDEGATVNMVVELAEAGYVGKILASEGEKVEVGQAVMIMCEEEESLDKLQKATSPEVDLYGDDALSFRVATYQGYLKDKKPEKGPN